MKNILVLAHFLSPTKGSEFSVAWNYITHMSKSNKLIVVYGSSSGIFNDVSEMADYLSENLLDNVKFLPVKCDNTLYSKILFLIYKRETPFFDLVWNLIYKNWQKAAWREVRSIVATEEIDIIHYLSPIGFKEPGYLWKIDKPYIWGPVKGVDSRPMKLFKALTLKYRLISICRNIILKLILFFSVRVRKAMKISDVVIAATNSTKDQFEKIFNKSCVYFPENSIIEIESINPIHKEENENLRLVWIGRLDFNKALIILLDALATMKDSSWELHVIGSGDLEAQLKSKTKLFCIEDNIIWHGQVSRKQVQSVLKNSHLHVVSSLSEGNPTTIWEAMSKGVPTLTLNHCGMKDTICDNCGIKIQIVSYNQVVRDIADNIQKLIHKPKEIERLSKGTLECAKKYTWDKRVTFFNAQYNLAIDNFNKKYLKD